MCGWFAKQGVFVIVAGLAAGWLALAAEPPKVAKQIDDDRDLQRAVARANGRLRGVPKDDPQQPLVFNLPWYSVDLRIERVSLRADDPNQVEVLSTLRTLHLPDADYLLPSEKKLLEQLTRQERFEKKEARRPYARPDPDDPHVLEREDTRRELRGKVRAAVEARRKEHTECSIVVRCPGPAETWQKEIRLRGIVRIEGWREAQVGVIPAWVSNSYADEKPVLDLPRSIVRVEAAWLGDDPPSATQPAEKNEPRVGNP